MERQPHSGESFPDRRRQPFGLGSVAAVHDRVIKVAFERDARVRPRHPRFERVCRNKLADTGETADRCMRCRAVPSVRAVEPGGDRLSGRRLHMTPH